ncbi:hypothetical protein O3M35_010928 [Rhynocoris fuscipes]|uniref:MIF4G domain-containing protein n=1 Tax=Rhynocoris fuscipes TaxID=488301 RepID=A0AAW1D1S7_9HEMI
MKNQMGPPKFVSMRPKDSLTAARKAKGISLCEFLTELNKAYEKDTNQIKRNEKDIYRNLSEEDRNAQDQLKILRGALNKLAPDNFYIQLLEIHEHIPTSNGQLLKIFVRQFIDKAINEDLYSPLYAQVCHALRNVELLEIEEDFPFFNFGEVIIDECSARFSFYHSDINWFSFPVSQTEQDKLKMIEYEENKRKLLVGVSRFLGDLFNAGMIGIKDMFHYINKLEEAENDKSIESLCKLLTTAGKELESSVFQTEFAELWCNTCERIINLSKKETLKLKLRFLLMNLMDLINKGWQSRILRLTPKTSAEILMEDKYNKDDLLQSTENAMSDVLLNNELISEESSVTETEQQILKLLKTYNEADSEITKWELENFKGRKTWLIYALTRAVLRVSIEGNSINRKTFIKFTTLLRRYIMSRQAEVACMYAVQYIVIVEMNNPKGLIEQICELLYENSIVSYISFLDWRENWSKIPVLEVKGKAEAHITLANFFFRLFWISIKPSPNYNSIVKELNSFDLEHFVSIAKLPPEIGKRIKLEEERENALLQKPKDETNFIANDGFSEKT